MYPYYRESFSRKIVNEITNARRVRKVVKRKNFGKRGGKVK